MNLLYAEFVSSIDTLSDPLRRRATVILGTSPYGRVVRTPAGVSLESINRPPARELFNRSHIPAGVLLEGKYQSVFSNRMVAHLGINPASLVEESPETRMMVFSDGPDGKQGGWFPGKTSDSPLGMTGVAPDFR